MATVYDKVMEYAAKTELRVIPENPQAIGEANEPNCGDVLKIAFSTKREIITEIGYNITESACPPVYACAAAAVELAKGKAAIEAYLIGSKQISALLSNDGTLDNEHIHCAMMAELALKRAVIDYSKSKQKNTAE